MKTLVSIIALITIGLAGGENNKAAEESAESARIAHVSYEQPASFGFGNNFYLDADKDGENDFLFTTVYETEGGNILTKYVVTAMNDNEVLAVGSNTAVEEEGNEVTDFANIHWMNGATDLIEQVNENKWNGVWSGDRAQYIGIKLVKDGAQFKGWVKINIDQAGEQALVEGYAVNQLAGGQISAGQI